MPYSKTWLVPQSQELQRDSASDGSRHGCDGGGGTIPAIVKCVAVGTSYTKRVSLIRGV